MDTNINNLDNSEKNRILEMHIKKGYKTILESPMDSMFYPGDDYVKDMGKSLSDEISSMTDKIMSIPDEVISKIPNLDEVIESVNNFFGGDVNNMSTSEIEVKIESELSGNNLNESWIDDYDKFESPHYSEKLDSKLSDVKGGFMQKVLSLIGKIFGINILSFGIIGSILLKTLGIITVSPIMSLVVSMIALFVISVMRRIMYYKKRNESN